MTSLWSPSIYSEATVVYSLPIWMALSDMEIKTYVCFKDLIARRAIIFCGLHVLVPHVRPHIFPFFDASPTDEARKSHGTGLGLSRHKCLQVLFWYI